MKEFEKHDKKYCDRETSHCCLSLDIYCEHCAELRKIGWQAALEWVLEIKKNGDILAQHNDDILMAIEGEINKELEDERV